MEAIRMKYAMHLQVAIRAAEDGPMPTRRLVKTIYSYIKVTEVRPVAYLPLS